MGIRGEVFSQKVILPNRTYFFNVKENRMGDLYLNIVESKNRDNGGFERQSVILFADDLQEFLKGFEESLKVLEKATREKRQGGKGNKPSSSRRDAGKQGSQREDERGDYPNKERSGERPGRVRGSERPMRGDRPARGFGDKRGGERSEHPGRERSERTSRGNSPARGFGDKRGGERSERPGRERSERPPRGNSPARDRGGQRDDRGRGASRERSERKPGGDRRPDRNKRVVVRKRD